MISLICLAVRGVYRPVQFEILRAFESEGISPVLERIKKGTRPYFWNALYQQRPTAPEGAEFPPEYFTPDIWFTEWPDDMQIKLMAVDPSKGKERGDYSAIVWMGVKNGIFYVDADIAKRPPAQIITDTLARCVEFHPSAVGVESNAFQELLGDRIAEQAAKAGITSKDLDAKHGTSRVLHGKGDKAQLVALDDGAGTMQAYFCTVD